MPVDYRAKYINNEDFRGYVNRYSMKHGITVWEALQHKLVRYYLEYLEETDKGYIYA